MLKYQGTLLLNSSGEPVYMMLGVDKDVEDIDEYNREVDAYDNWITSRTYNLHKGEVLSQGSINYHIIHIEEVSDMNYKRVRTEKHG